MSLRARARAFAFALPLAACATVAPVTRLVAQQPWRFEDVRAYPFPNELTAQGSRIAWAFNEQGRRNVWVAEAPDFAPRQLTRYDRDDGQELTSLAISPDGRWIVYVRGGEHGSNWERGAPVNPMSMPVPQPMGIWSIPVAGGEPKLLAEGDAPAISPRGDVVAFVRDGQVWSVPVDGSAAATRLVRARGESGDLQWSPDGRKLAFVSSRGTHALIGIYAGDSTPITWLSPSTARDRSPRWSPDGRRLAFVRTAAGSGPADSLLVQRHAPWSIWTADAATGAATQRWAAPATLRGSVPTTHGGTNLHWAAEDRIVFVSYHDGWPHLYSMPSAGGAPMLLTPGDYMVEHVSLSPDRRTLVFSANAGSTPEDLDRRHVVRTPVDRAAPEVLTPGAGLEWTPVVLGDGAQVAYISATAQRPPLPTIRKLAGDTAARVLAADRIPRRVPVAQLVTPRQVVFRAPDGTPVHAQLFAPHEGGRRPAVVFVHGGPPRQMLLGWHYSDYYANTYAVNQYLASRGFVVLSVNYRLGIGYGYEFHRPANAGAQGAVEYQDVKAAAEWLAARPDVDAKRIGIWGGSYGGFLTALALARDSDLFAAGVDLHGVHDWTTERARGIMERDRYEQPADLDSALARAWRASPVSSMDSWRSPVLVIHGDDDRNVRFAQSVDLVRRLQRAGVPFEELMIPDDTHHWMRHANAVKAGEATADFFVRRLMTPATADGRQK